MARVRGGKNGSHARQAVKNGRRLIRRSNRMKRWMHRQPLMRMGPGGTDKTAIRNNGKEPRFSQKPALGPNGIPVKVLPWHDDAIIGCKGWVAR